jgi:hypothetical protein
MQIFNSNDGVGKALIVSEDQFPVQRSTFLDMTNSFTCFLSKVRPCTAFDMQDLRTVQPGQPNIRAQPYVFTGGDARSSFNP